MIKNLYKPDPFKRSMFYIIFDIILSLFSLYSAYGLRFNFEISSQYLEQFWIIFFIIVILKISAFSFYHLYQVAWRFFSLHEAKKMLYSHIFAYGLFSMIFLLSGDFFNPFPRSVIIIDFILSMLTLGIFRISKRLYIENMKKIQFKKSILIGVSGFTQTFLKNNEEHYIYAIFDDDERMVGSYIIEYKIKDIKYLESILKQEEIDSIVITKSYEHEMFNYLLDTLSKYNINDIQILQLNNKVVSLKPLGVEDLLARNPKDLDSKKIEDFIYGKRVLITGAGGSIGSELVRQVVKFKASEVILLDHSEYNLYKISEELSINDTPTYSVMQNIRFKDDLERTFKKYKPQIVIHAAAYKHVPLVEDNIEEAINNNIFGTKNVIDLSVDNGVEKLVLISTDKAVRPTNVMGTTKRICELYAQNVPSKTTQIVAVRFGNVLGSSGSVIPKFQEQLDKNQNLTVTHPDITRYFMLISEACALVLQAASIGKGSELFVLDMGEPVKIANLAKKMIELSGKNVEIEFTGLRAGEKLYEELLISQSDKKTEYDSIMVVKATKYEYELLLKDLEHLKVAEDKLLVLKKIVPEFIHNSGN